jgi:cytochrome c oxidase assembly protein subunit 15
MGCPDWPKCFGRWSPPTSIEQLPEDYKERYAALREKKNEKFARYLQLVGLDETAQQILTDKAILVEADFNPVKSWIEYINRLVGVAIGFFIIAVAWQSRKLRHEHRWVFIVSVATLVTVIIQGWFGSIVVSTNLTTWTVTVHMFLALVIVMMLVFLYERTRPSEPVPSDWGIRVLVQASMLVLLLQVFFGTEVRSVIDRLALEVPRNQWISEAGIKFLTHRSFSWTVLIIHFLLIVKMRKTGGLNSLSLGLIVLILGTFLTGVVMAWWAVPAFLQPLHLLLATLAFGFEAHLLMRLWPDKKVITSTQPA